MPTPCPATSLQVPPPACKGRCLRIQSAKGCRPQASPPPKPRNRECLRPARKASSGCLPCNMLKREPLSSPSHQVRHAHARKARLSDEFSHCSLFFVSSWLISADSAQNSAKTLPSSPESSLQPNEGSARRRIFSLNALPETLPFIDRLARPDIGTTTGCTDSLFSSARCASRCGAAFLLLPSSSSSLLAKKKKKKKKICHPW